MVWRRHEITINIPIRGPESSILIPLPKICNHKVKVKFQEKSQGQNCGKKGVGHWS